MHLVPLFLCLLPIVATAHSVKTATTRGIPSDVKYIQCSVCEHVTTSLINTIQTHSTPITEIFILDLVESVCDPSSPNSQWLHRLDMVEQSRRIKLLPQQSSQKCTQECHTIALACRQALQNIETELSEYLYKQYKLNSLNQKELHKWLCHKRKGMSTACRFSTPPTPKDRKPGPLFEPLDEKAEQLEALMKQMKQSGQDVPNMDMFTKEQFMNSQAGDDEDDEDEEDKDQNINDDIGMEDTALGESVTEPIDDMKQEQTSQKDLAAGVDVKSDEL